MENSALLLHMGSPSRPASPQEHPPALLLPPPLIPTSSKDTCPATQSENSVSAATGTPDSLWDAEDHASARPGIPSAISRRLYISHFLSTWNSRSFEFASVLFLASIFLATLLPLSIYALVRSTSAIIFAPIIGRAIDRSNRLAVVRFSIGKFSLIAPEAPPPMCIDCRKSNADIDPF